MPRRTKIFIEPGKTLVNGSRRERDTIDPSIYDPILDEIPVDISEITAKVTGHIQSFEELSTQHHNKQLMADLADEIAHAIMLRLDCLTRGARTKPDEWRTQMLVAGVRATLERYDLAPAVSEYERRGELVQHWFLRLVPWLLNIAGLRAPSDEKGLCLRAQRIEIE
jgi:hypothetical protein